MALAQGLQQLLLSSFHRAGRGLLQQVSHSKHSPLPCLRAFVLSVMTLDAHSLTVEQESATAMQLP